MLPEPANKNCLHCDEPVEDGRGEVIQFLGEDGVEPRPIHPECAMRHAVGGLNHQRGLCFCCGGKEPPDPPEMSAREAALAAVAFWRERNPRR